MTYIRCFTVAFLWCVIYILITHSHSWLEENIPKYYARTCEVCGPYLVLACDKMHAAGVWLVEAVQPAREWVVKTTPLVIAWVRHKPSVCNQFVHSDALCSHPIGSGKQNMKISNFLSLLKTELAKVVEMLVMEDKDLSNLHSQHHGCWCPGNTRDSQYPSFIARKINTVKPVFNNHLMGYFSAFWSSLGGQGPPRWAPERQTLLARVNWYLRSSLKRITE